MAHAVAADGTRDVRLVRGAMDARPSAVAGVNNEHNRERVQRFAQDFRGVRLAEVDRPTARPWAQEHRANVAAVGAMFGDAVRDGLTDTSPFAELRPPGLKGREDIAALTENELHVLADLALDERMKLAAEYGREYRAMILSSSPTSVALRPRHTSRAATSRPLTREATASRASS